MPTGDALPMFSVLKKFRHFTHWTYRFGHVGQNRPALPSRATVHLRLRYMGLEKGPKKKVTNNIVTRVGCERFAAATCLERRRTNQNEIRNNRSSSSSRSSGSRPRRMRQQAKSSTCSKHNRYVQIRRPLRPGGPSVRPTLSLPSFFSFLYIGSSRGFFMPIWQAT
jgi:hypothetical protein